MYQIGVGQDQAGQVGAGLQDNGTILLDNGEWEDMRGADGFEVYVSQNSDYDPIMSVIVTIVLLNVDCI